MEYNYVISSPVRVGSHYVMHLLTGCRVPVTKTHEPLSEVDYEKTRLLLLYRRDRFSTIMSHSIWKRTRESEQYTNQKIEPFEVSRSEFDNHWTHNDKYYSYHDFTRPYAGVYRLIFEDILADHNNLFKKFDLKFDSRLDDDIREIFPWARNQSPYRYQDIIRNHQQCLEWFHECEQNRSW